MADKTNIAWIVLIVGLWVAAGLLSYNNMIVTAEYRVMENLSIEQLSSPEWVSNNIPEMPEKGVKTWYSGQ